MSNRVLRRAEAYIKTHFMRQWWYRALAVLAALAVFCTTYALILPAITLTKDPICGFTEHTHGPECYAVSADHNELPCTKELHEHEYSCFDPEGEVTCGYADFLVHTHNELCYGEDAELVCQLPEIKVHAHEAGCYPAAEVRGAEEAHSHSEACYTRQKGELTCQQEVPQAEHLVCSKQEAEPHEHTEPCYETTRTLSCPIPENHQHGDGCYDEEGIQVCGLTQEHTHTDGCYEEAQTLSCQLPTEGHTHQDDCYAPAAAGDAHEHSDECYAWQEELTCKVPEGTSEDEKKPEAICGRKEAILHEHKEECYDAAKALICEKLELFEHIHTEECFDPHICGLTEHIHDKRHCYLANDEELTPEEVPEEAPEDAPEETTDAETEKTEAPVEVLSSKTIPLLMLYDDKDDAAAITLKAVTDEINPDAYEWQWQSSSDGVSDWTELSGANKLLYQFSAEEETLASYYRILGTKLAVSRSAITEFFAGNNTADLPERIVSNAVSPLDDPAIREHLAPTSPDDGSYYLYFYDFERDGRSAIAHTIGGIAAGEAAEPYYELTVPEGLRWDGGWYLDRACTIPYDFDTPVSDMEAYLTGEYQRDLYLYPGGEEIWNVEFVSNGSYLTPLQLPREKTFNISQEKYTPTRSGYIFDGWYLDEGFTKKAVGTQSCPKNVCTVYYYAKWLAEYVPFEAMLRTENANDTGFTRAKSLGIWYAVAGSTIKVETIGRSPDYVHRVKCELDGKTYPVYTDAALMAEATLADVYESYFVFNDSTKQQWTQAFGSAKPYSTQTIASNGEQTVIHFDYMRAAVDLTFRISDASGYIDIHQLVQRGLLGGTVNYHGAASAEAGSNVSASGVTAKDKLQWSYTSADDASTEENVYILYNVKYGQRIADAFPTALWLTDRVENRSMISWNSLPAEDSRNGKAGLVQRSRLQQLPDSLMAASGRRAAARTLQAVYPEADSYKQALIYAIECLPGEPPDFTLHLQGSEAATIDFKVSVEDLELQYHTTADVDIKSIPGCTPLEGGGVSMKTDGSENIRLLIPGMGSDSGGDHSDWWVSDVPIRTLVKKYAAHFGLPANITESDAQALIGSDRGLRQVYVLHYVRDSRNVRFNFNYDADEDSELETETYEGLQYGQSLSDYRYAMADGTKHELLSREGYRFLGWMDETGEVYAEEDWERMQLNFDGETTVFYAKWEALADNVIEYYETAHSAEPFEWHFFKDGTTVPRPEMAEHPAGWRWTNARIGKEQSFSFDVPLYGAYGVSQELTIDGQTKPYHVIRIYGDWVPSQVRVGYDANVEDGGIQANAPVDPQTYELSETKVPVKAMTDTTNNYGKRFVGWDLDRNGLSYQPGDYVEAAWMPSMVFTARWAEPEDAVKLIYEPNGGSPETRYHSENSYERGAETSIWDNTTIENQAQTQYYSREGYRFIGWNTAADGSGIAYTPGTQVTLTEELTTLYAQWQPDTYTLVLQMYYEAMADNSPVALPGTKFELYDGDSQVEGTLISDEKGEITVYALNVGTRYHLIETEVPDGFVPLREPIRFEVTETETLKFYDAYGNVIKNHKNATAVYDGSDPMDRQLILSVRNDKGYKLAETGGIGTFPYTLAGLLVVGAAVSLFMYNTHRRQKRRHTSSRRGD